MSYGGHGGGRMAIVLSFVSFAFVIGRYVVPTVYGRFKVAVMAMIAPSQAPRADAKS